ncbi:Alpha/Beta hydrolase protein [Fennellomyces sp. T-0311]|nr:Alpha/Beta hydrolase protein [Fennellomyces sp. T-0311]
MFVLATVAVLLLAITVVIQSPRHQSIIDSDVGTAILHLKSHSLRVKKTHTCESSEQFSGYVDNLKTNNHLFFTFYESRSSFPKGDPLVLWLNGGPGCSSLAMALIELGPCIVSPHHSGVRVNPYSWNTNANILFLDQPANTGYSYGNYGVKNSLEAAWDIFMFLQLFLLAFPQLAKSQLHIAGESFAGHYIPAVAAEILGQNRIGEYPPLNLHSLVLGNGWVDPLIQLQYYEPYGCANDSSYKPIFDETICKQMRDTSHTCQKLMNACYKYPSSITCVPAGLYCQQTQLGPYDKTGRNFFDIRQECHHDSELCYNITDRVNSWADDSDVRLELGIDKNTGRFITCNDRVQYRFALSGDMTISYAPQIAEALEAGIRVLIYSGDMDWTCNWYGGLAWTVGLQWSGQPEYSRAYDQNWYSIATGKFAGQFRTHKNFMFLKVHDAGHWVPYDQPAHALEFFTAWIENRTLSTSSLLKQVVPS